MFKQGSLLLLNTQVLILFPVPIALDFLPSFFAFSFCSLQTKEVFPSEHSCNTPTPQSGHQSSSAFPDSLSHTHSWAQEMLQKALAQNTTQRCGSVTTHCSPAQERGLIEGLMPIKRRRRPFTLLDNFFYLSQTPLTIAFPWKFLAHLKFLAAACHGFVPIDCSCIHTGEKSLSSP